MSGVNGLYVASNPTSLSAQFQLIRNLGGLSDTLTRLSTGLRINSGKDDPAGLIVSELLKSDIAGTTQAITNIQRGNSMLSTADSAMGNINSLLTDIKSLVVGAANTGAMSADQINANQLQVNATLEAIDQIATSTTYSGQRILDGSMDFSTNANLTNGLSDVTVYSANFGTGNSIGVNVNVLEAAKRGTLVYNGTGVNQRTTLDITGSVGTKTITVGTAGQFTSNQEIANAINSVSDSTGVQAYVEGKAARGSITLSSAGANNDIVITATAEGLDAGNYSFRITQGTGDNSARIVKDAVNGNQGVVEISLKGSYEQNFNNFAGLFDVNVNTGDAAAARSISLTRGTTNSAIYHENASNATGSNTNVSVAYNITAGGRNSDLNGWTIKVDSLKASGATAPVADLNTKTLYINKATANGDVTTGLATALANTVGGTGTPSLAFAIPPAGVNEGGTAGYALGLTEGQSITLGGGAEAGEITVTYKEGATVGDIQKLLNGLENVTASLKSGVSGSQLIPNLPNGQTYSKANSTTMSKYSSSASAAEVVALINAQLGDKFNAQMLSGDTGSGKVSYMDAYALHGDFNSDNMLRFSGMDNGPVVRLTNLDSSGQKVANQALSVEIKHPSDEDIKAGIHTPVLEIHLATDAAGNSITTAQDIAKLFDTLPALKTLGVSAEVVTPPGVDPNGRIWTTDSCGNAIEIQNCGSQWGLGIVQPTSGPGSCGALENDIALLGSNQYLADDYAVARISSANVVTQADAVAGDSTNNITFLHTSALNGVTFKFTTDETKEGFVVNGEGADATGTLTIYVDASLPSTTDTKSIIAGAIAANWESIREYTGTTAEPIAVNQIQVNGTPATVSGAIGTIGSAGFTIPKTAGGDNTNGVAGADASDPALIIKSKTVGPDMAGISIHFVNDPTKGLSGATAATATTSTAVGTTINPPDISVEFQTKSDGSRELIVYANITDGNRLTASDLAAALNNNDVFKSMFEAQATLAGGSNGGTEDTRLVNTVLFNDAHAIEHATYQTVGGYKVASNNEAGTTSSGLNMLGQSDNNERLIMVASDVGSENFVKVTVREGSLDTYCPLGTRLNELHGTDVVATVNGLSASARGNVVSLNTPDLALSVKTDGTVGTKSFDITGGGALFQIGPNVISSQQKRIGIASMMTTAIGGGSGKLFQLRSGGDADLSKSDASRKLADKIVNESIAYVANARGRMGALQSGLFDPMVGILQDQLIALTEAQGSIANADFAEESSRMMQFQLLVQAGMQTLGIANQMPQYAASLIR